MVKRIEFTETNEGYVEIDIPEGATEEDIEELALEAIENGEGMYCDGWNDVHAEKLNYDDDGIIILEEEE